MKVILCTGNPHSGHEQVFELLVQAGVVPARPTGQGAMTPRALQTQLLLSHEVDLSAPSPLAQVQPGKVWGQLAVDLYLANVQSPVWGWVDHQTAVLLDFWQDFDTQVRLALIYSTPEDHLAQLLEGTQTPTPQSISEALEQWTRWNTALLRHYHRNPTHCVLLNSQQAMERPDALLKVLAKQWHITGLDAAFSPSTGKAYNHLQSQLLSQLIDPQHPALALRQELDGAAQLPSMWGAGPLGDARHYAAWSDWVGLRGQLAELAQCNSEVRAENVDLKETKAQLEEKLAVQLVQQAQLAHQQSESELLLLQLHQVQEELEHYFVLYQELQQQQQSKASGIVTDFWQVHQPAELCIDMRQDVVGSNWYPPEFDGCWAGPALVSSVQMPPLKAGNYTLTLEVVDAMHPDIVQGMLLEALGQSVGFEIEPLSPDSDYPLVCKAQLYIAPASPPEPWPISLRFTHLVSPAESGSDDYRQLAIRLQTLSLSKSL